MRRSAFADAAADWAYDALGSATSGEAQRSLMLPISSASFSSGPLSSPEQEGGEFKLLPLLCSGKGTGKATLDATPERHHRLLPPESWHRRAWWRGAVSGAVSALALLCLVVLAFAAISSPPPSSVSSSSAVSASPRAPRGSGNGGRFARRGSLPPPRVLSDDAQGYLSSSDASKSENEVEVEVEMAAGKGGGVTDGSNDVHVKSGVSASRPSSSFSSSKNNRRGRTLVSYAYFEKDDVQAANLAFFSAFGMGLATKEEKGGRGGSSSTKAETSERRLRRRSPFLPPPPPATDFVVVVSGASCTPCATFASILLPDARARLPGAPRGISGAWSGVVVGGGAGGGGGGKEEPETFPKAATAAAEEGGLETTSTVTLLHRVENDGMDFGAHNVTLEWVAFLERRVSRGKEARGEQEGSSENDDDARSSSPPRHRRHIFLNSSARGPFLPKYLPEGWYWTDAFSRDLDEEEKQEGEYSGEAGQSLEKKKREKSNNKPVALVGAALTCLPLVDAGGPGPRVESWAFALSARGLQVAKEAGVFGFHGCKLCADGVVVAGEYGLSLAVLRSGRNLATLMSRYGRGVDWSLEEHWGCNDNVHPSRHATYDGIDMHPFETLFVKSSWYVGEPFVSAYSRWAARLAAPSSSSSISTSPLAGNDGGGENDDGNDGDERDEAFSFDAGTGGHFDEARYRYAISPKAQDDWGVSECFGKGAPELPGWRRSEANNDSGGGGWRTWWRT